MAVRMASHYGGWKNQILDLPACALAWVYAFGDLSLVTKCLSPRLWVRGLVPHRSWQFFGMALANWPPLSLPPFRIQISSFLGILIGFQYIIFLLLQLEYVYLLAIMNTEWQMQWCGSLIAGWYRPSFFLLGSVGLFLNTKLSYSQFRKRH